MRIAQKKESYGRHADVLDNTFFQLNKGKGLRRHSHMMPSSKTSVLKTLFSSRKSSKRDHRSVSIRLERLEERERERDMKKMSNKLTKQQDLSDLPSNHHDSELEKVQKCPNADFC